MVSEVRGRKVALAVDQFLGYQEVFVKPLGRPLGGLKGLIGGAIIGNGEVVLILDIANITIISPETRLRRNVAIRPILITGKE